MNKNVRVIYKKVTENLKKKGYININHRPVNTLDELVDIASIFRSPEYETFRIIYMKDNNIAGYESISSRIPLCVPLFRNKNANYANHERGFYKVQDRMKRLGANGYYLVHNHPSGNAKASSEDIKTTKEFIRNVDGFKGHLVLGINEYAWIGENKGELTAQNYIPINFKKVDKLTKMMKKQSIYDVKITSRSDLISFVSMLNRTKDFSSVIFTDASNKVRCILDMPNKMLNQRTKNLNGFVKNIARTVGATRAFFATEDERTFDKAMAHQSYGTFHDAIYYKEKEGNKLELAEATNIRPLRDLFEDEIHSKGSLVVNFSEMVSKANGLSLENAKSIDLSLNEEKGSYREIPVEDEVLEKEEIDLSKEDNFLPNQKQIRILVKKVGEDPIVKVIPNTLEAKQKIVGGLIEVVPYQDDMLLVCNDEGKIIGLKPNVCFDMDYIAGDMFVIGDDYKNADFRSLTDEEITRAKEDLMSRSIIYEDQNKDYTPKHRKKTRGFKSR